jgi:hypothetical protein
VPSFPVGFGIFPATESEIALIATFSANSLVPTGIGSMRLIGTHHQ